MTHNITAEDILAAIGRQKQRLGLGTEIVIAPREHISREREQFNNSIIKELNNTSLLSGEDETAGQSPLSETPSGAVAQKDFGSIITPPRELTYRSVTVQQCRPGQQRAGVRLHISLQTAIHQAQGERLLVTAELKRYDRLREVKSRLTDSSLFAQLLETAKRDIHTAKNRDLCLGRIHYRGKRSAWIQDAMVVAHLVEDRATWVLLYLEHEQYHIEMDRPLTPAQQAVYVASGQQGDLINSAEVAPRLSDLKPRRFGA